jgi:hypothetical protein
MKRTRYAIVIEEGGSAAYALTYLPRHDQDRDWSFGRPTTRRQRLRRQQRLREPEASDSSLLMGA